MPRPLFVAEPTAVWRARAPLVVDCSIVAASLFDEPDADVATRALGAHSLHAPALLPFEFANVARSKSRAGAPEAKVQAALQTFDELRIELHPVSAARMHALALTSGLTAYDAAYLTLALALGSPLLTLDQKLATAAARALGRPE